MNVIEKILAEGLPHVEAMPGLAGEIRDAFAAGRKELEGVRDEAVAFKDAIVAKARSGLDAFKAEVERVEKQAEGKPDTDSGKDDAPPTPAVDLEAGTTTHTAADGIVTTLDHDAGTVTAKDDEGSPVVPHPDDVKAVVQAAVDAGVAVPEALAADAGATPPAPALSV